MFLKGFKDLECSLKRHDFRIVKELRDYLFGIKTTYYQCNKCNHIQVKSEDI